VSTALSALTGALANNAAKPKGANALDQALAEDHDGSILGKIGDFLGDVSSGPGAGILSHVLGRKQSAVEVAIGQETGLPKEKVSNLLVTVAPLLMGALGKQKQEQGLDAAGIAGLLSGQSMQIQQQASGGLGGIMSLVGAAGSSGLLGKLIDFIKGLFGGKKKS
jgi:hypothetical protein